MLTSKQAGVTGLYDTCKDWDAVLAHAEKELHLKRLVANYRSTKHPACLNSIMLNAGSMGVWLAYYTGRYPNRD